MLRLHSIETFGTNEGPGIRVILFLQGCHFRCLYCHNPDTQSLSGGKPYSAKALMELILRQKPYFKDRGGVTVSGGEPLIQAKGLIELFRLCRKNGISTCLSTNGNFLDDTVKTLLDLTDLVLLDLKHIDSEKHRKLTGFPNETPLRFSDHLRRIGKRMWLRLVLVPGHTDDPADLERLGKHFRDFQNIEELCILPYHTLGVYKYAELGIPYALANVHPPSREDVEKAKTLLAPYFKTVSIR